MNTIRRFAPVVIGLFFLIPVGATAQTIPGIPGLPSIPSIPGIPAIPGLPTPQLFPGLAAPPALPDAIQPILSQVGQIWQPGNWANTAAGYSYVPGTWVTPPATGEVYTPGYWSSASNGYQWNPGYWGQNVGYYGGVNYGNGYYGDGYTGGRWEGSDFVYNTAASNVNPTIIKKRYVDKTVIVTGGNRASFNGPGGVNSKPNAKQIADAKQRHIPETSQQREHRGEAESDRDNLLSVNHGHPKHATVDRPFNKSNRPKDFKPVTEADRKAAHHNKADEKHEGHNKQEGKQNGNSQGNHNGNNQGKHNGNSQGKQNGNSQGNQNGNSQGKQSGKSKGKSSGKHTGKPPQ